MSSQFLQLKKHADKRLRAGHCWVYSNEIDTQVSPLSECTAGDQVELRNSAGKAIASLFVNPNSLICGRLISRNAQQFMDQSLISHRLKIALGLRQRAFQQPFYRLVYGDSDGLPGLVVDRFGEVLSVQISTVGMERLREAVIAALCKVLKPSGIVFKNDGKMRALEGLPEYVEVVHGEVDSAVDIEENGVRFVAPLLEGQKTAWFYDHRMNRERLKAYCADKRVLDLFSYVGAWGIQAAVFGAKEVVCVDASALALDFAETSAKRNGQYDKMTFLQGDAFEACKQLKSEGHKFDIVICDPPAFIPRRKDHRAGEQAYRRINQLAMQLLNKEGLLVSGSCSMHFSRDELLASIQFAARAVDRHAQLIEQGHQGPDHPVLPAVKETDYLKAQFVRILPSF